tara:strand:+ start:175 stop:624 length:450 start_codon:yes stop_codon:yes gene_type:complete
MNIVNVNKAIAVMERVKERGDYLNMRDWQFLEDSEAPAMETEGDLHKCGTAACFAGWVAVSPEFQVDRGSVCVGGAPCLPMREEGYYVSGEAAIRFWLGIDEDAAEHLCAMSDVANFYGKEVKDITVDDVLSKLYRLRDTGSVYAGGAQ